MDRHWHNEGVIGQVTKPRERLLFILAAAAVCVSCSSPPSASTLSSDSAAATTSRPAAEGAFASRSPAVLAFNEGIPAPPAPDPARLAAAAAQLSRSGVQTHSASALALPDPETGALTLQTLASEPNGSFCWAMYEFEGLASADLPAQLDTDLSGNLPARYYIGISNYMQGNWDWTEVAVPGAGNSAFVPGREAINSAGSVYCVIAVYGQSLCLDSISLTAGVALPPPQGLFATDDDPEGIRVSWDNPAISYDPDGNGPQKFLYDSVVLEQASSPSGPWGNLIELDSGVVNLSLASALGAVPELGQPYYLRLRTKLQGRIGPPGNAVRGVARLMVPQNLHATYVPLSNHISLGWSAVPNATSYEVQARPLGETEFITLGYSNSTDTEHRCRLEGSNPSYAQPGVTYEYQVRAIRGPKTFLSDFSAPASSQIDLPVPQDVIASQGNFDNEIVVTWNPVGNVTSYRWTAESLDGQYGDSGTVQSNGAVIPLQDPAWQNLQFNIRIAVCLPDVPAGQLDHGPYSEPVPGHFNFKPLASLSVLPADGPAPLEVTLDASASSGGDAPIQAYDWDYNGDGKVDTSTGAGQSSITRSYTAGLYKPRVIVRNTQGESREAVATVISGGYRRSWGAGGTQIVLAVAPTPQGRLYSLGTYSMYPDPARLFVLKHDSQGQLLWARDLGPFFSGPSFMVFSNNQLFIASRWHKKPTDAGVPALVRLSPQGELIAASSLVFAEPHTDPDICGFDCAPDGTLYICGRDAAYDCSLARLSSTGQPLWTKRLNESPDATNDFRLSFLAASSQPALVLGGDMYHCSPQYGPALIALDSAGDPLWQKICVESEARIRGLSANSDGLVYLARTSQIPGSDGAQIDALSPAGGLIWSFFFDSPLWQWQQNRTTLGRGPDGAVVFIREESYPELRASLPVITVITPATGVSSISLDRDEVITCCNALGSDLYLGGQTYPLKQQPSPAYFYPAESQEQTVDAAFSFSDSTLTLEDLSVDCTEASGVGDQPSNESAALLLKLAH